MVHGSKTRRGILFGCSLLSCSALHAQTRSGLDVDAKVEATSNPYLSDSAAGLVGAATVQVRPWVHAQTAGETFDLAAFANGRVFSGAYVFENSEGASLNVHSRRGERTRLFGSADISSTSARTAFPSSLPHLGVTDPLSSVDPAALATEPPPLLPGEDITLLGVSGRTTSISVAAGLEQQMDARSFFGLDVGHQRLSVEDSRLSSFNSANLEAHYLREFSGRTKVGVTVGARKAVYNAGPSTTTTYNLQGTVDRRLGAFWLLNAAAGLSTTHSGAAALFHASNSTGVIGSLTLCNHLPRRDVCLTYNRSQTPAASGQVRNVNEIGIQYSKRPSARDRIDVSGNYSRSTSLGGNLLQSSKVELASLQGTLTRTLGARTEGYLSASAARTYGSVLPSEPSLSVGMGIHLRMGRRS